MNIRQISANFTNKELACPHCWEQGIEYLPINKYLVFLLEEFRIRLQDIYKKEYRILILSACRCKEHNKAVGGSPTSKHIDGIAIDFYVPGLTLKELYKELEEWKLHIFGGVGIYPDNNFIHIDIDSRYARWVARNIDGKRKYIYFF